MGTGLVKSVNFSVLIIWMSTFGQVVFSVHLLACLYDSTESFCSLFDIPVGITL